MKTHNDLTIEIVNFIVYLNHDCDRLPKAYMDSYTDKLTSSSEQVIFNVFQVLVERLSKKELYPKRTVMGRVVSWSDYSDRAYLEYVALANQLTDRLFDYLILAQC